MADTFTGNVQKNQHSTFFLVMSICAMTEADTMDVSQIRY